MLRSYRCCVQQGLRGLQTEPGAAVLPEPAAGTSQSHILQSNLQTACGQTTVTPVLGCR